MPWISSVVSLCSPPRLTFFTIWDHFVLDQTRFYTNIRFYINTHLHNGEFQFQLSKLHKKIYNKHTAISSPSTNFGLSTVLYPTSNTLHQLHMYSYHQENLVAHYSQIQNVSSKTTKPLLIGVSSLALIIYVGSHKII